MKKIVYTLVLLTFFLFLYPRTISAQSYSSYIWNTEKILNLPSSQPVQDRISLVRQEVDKILSSGHLKPLRVSGADVIAEGYYMYHEPGRIITTLAMAYPYLSTAQQDSVKAYVNAELSNSSYTIWASNFLLPTAANPGTKREYYTLSQNWQWDWWFNQDGINRPRIYPLYGLWLYAYNSGDWTAIQNNWTSIKNFYSGRVNEARLYGGMPADIAMARMAYHLNDSAMITTATNNATSHFTNGLTFSNVDTAVQTYFKHHYTFFPGRQRYHGWMFLNMSPEVGQYIRDNQALKTAVLGRHALGEQTFGKWWLTRAWFEAAYSGHEASGLPSEVIGMMFPVERYVLQTPSSELFTMTKSLPSSIGDSYMIESYIMALESAGTPCWENIQTTTQECINSTSSPTPTPKPGDVDGIGGVTLSDLTILLSNFGKSGMSRIQGDLTGDGSVTLPDLTQLLANFGK